MLPTASVTVLRSVRFKPTSIIRHGCTSPAAAVAEMGGTIAAVSPLQASFVPTRAGFGALATGTWTGRASTAGGTALLGVTSEAICSAGAASGAFARSSAVDTDGNMVRADADGRGGSGACTCD